MYKKLLFISTFFINIIINIYSEYYICLSSFTDINELKRIVTEILNENINVIYEKVVINNKIFYRVYLDKVLKNDDEINFEFIKLRRLFYKKIISKEKIWVKKGKIENQVFFDFNKKDIIATTTTIASTTTTSTSTTTIAIATTTTTIISTTTTTTTIAPTTTTSTTIEKSILSVYNIINSEAIKKELDLLEKIYYLSTEKVSIDQLRKELVYISNEFEKILSYFESLESDDIDIKEAINNQIELCKIYINIKDQLLENDDIQPVLKQFYFAEKYFQQFLNSIERKLKS